MRPLIIVLAALLLGAPAAAAPRWLDGFVKGEAGVAAPLSSPQRDYFSPGFGGTLKLGVGFYGFVDVQATGVIVSLPARAAAPSPETSYVGGVGGGVRLKLPYSYRVSPWVDFDALYVRTGPLDRFAYSVGVGLHVPLGKRRMVRLGPFVRLLQIVDASRPGFDDADAVLLLAGLSVEVGTPRRRPSPPPSPAPMVKQPEPPPPPPVAPPPPPPPPPVAPPPPPPVEKPPVKLTETKIEIDRKILFDTGKAEVLPASFGLLDEVTNVLQANPTLHVRIEGHTDDRGDARMNQRLSQARAEAVKRYLVEHGIDGARLGTRGFGADRPLAPNDTAEGREKNRRVEFVIVR